MRHLFTSWVRHYCSEAIVRLALENASHALDNPRTIECRVRCAPSVLYLLPLRGLAASIVTWRVPSCSLRSRKALRIICIGRPLRGSSRIRLLGKNSFAAAASSSSLAFSPEWTRDCEKDARRLYSSEMRCARYGYYTRNQPSEILHSLFSTIIYTFKFQH